MKYELFERMLKHAHAMLHLGTRKGRLGAAVQRCVVGQRKVVCSQCHRYPEPYMVHDEVWEQAGLDKRECCCLSCLEKLLDRPVTILDLTQAPINTGYAFFFMQGAGATSNILRNKS